MCYDNADEVKNMETIEVLPIRVRVTGILRKALLAGDFQPGEELSLTDTAARLGVSRTPVREAFQALAAEGLLELRMNRGAIVVGIDEKFIRDHFELRMLLETEAVVRAASRNLDLAPMLQLQDWAEQNADTMTEEEYRTYNQRFHAHIWRGADNRRLYDLLSSLWNGPSGGIIGRDQAHERLSIAEHRSMLTYLQQREGAAAGGIMGVHIKRSMENILGSFRSSRSKK